MEISFCIACVDLISLFSPRAIDEGSFGVDHNFIFNDDFLIFYDVANLDTVIVANNNHFPKRKDLYDIVGDDGYLKPVNCCIGTL
jgi:hypothetical protein